MTLLARLFGQRKLPKSPQLIANSGHWESLIRIIEIVRHTDSVPDLTSFSGHHSGYIREAAISRCLEISSPEMLPAVVDRLNDWVPEVRKAARSAILTMLATIPGRYFLASLPGIYSLRTATRTDHSEWINQFERTFVQSVEIDTLANAVIGYDKKVARACFAFIRQQQLFESLSLIELAVKSGDIQLSIQAVDLCGSLSDADKLTQLNKLVQSPFGVVRAMCLRILLSEKFDIDNKAIALQHLIDRQSSVRDIAFDWLKAQYFDLRDFYLNTLEGVPANSKDICACILAIAKLKNVDDVELLKSYSKSPIAIVRYTALMAWTKIDEAIKDEVAHIALADVSPRVRKLAMRLVRKYGAFIEFETIRDHIHERLDVGLALSLSETNKWNWLECIVILASEQKVSEEYSARLNGELRNWIRTEGRSYEAPTSRQIRLLSAPENLRILRALQGDVRPKIDEILCQHFPLSNISAGNIDARG